MKKIEAIIRKTKFEDVKEALLSSDINWFEYHDGTSSSASPSPSSAATSSWSPPSRSFFVWLTQARLEMVASS